MYYNTLSESGETLKDYKSKAKTQTEKVLGYFTSAFGNIQSRKLSASLILPLMNCPITSIRRALNTLENDGKIVKTGIQITGLYGRKENMYKLKNRPNNKPQ